ncbi:alpha-D-ribose 1-methylphosphonate 5-phosphate C-P-lyase PhnJ [Poseidonibacter lekithochrous]|uniref:alpha-D-ribose 1-methylphosphonate 5-phosphate C-P-lyase PhnJ n=1 Tax=Poseidonibacter TaxID=2321187 RepID=UPI001C0A2E0C|nr:MULTISPECIES: alpha-D-ribose 1-methylphosphonate 5-phosphate C-P-lyase PhnJ [Poseidonibacter]MBU3015036.1 alpha-D-ribose 1-methylphosphonate 5-phosphate C-P-lyase PhnJ [Poseidonibacter lekithochrous]MDO6828333.1 alpha-D-ribose 1-methylphosphonate 5-phosphate C-P-lyase PhnJ [Poseidonibacter sp. 1_MG-2023]
MRYAFLDEEAKKEIRRSILKAIAIPGYIVSFASRELPVARGWGTGGLQVTLAIINEEDNLKVIDQGCDGSVNAVNIRNFISSVTNVETTTSTKDATIIQTRHRIPEIHLEENQTLVFQVPMPDILETVEPNISKAKLLHANADYSKLWVLLYEDTSQFGDSRISNRYPVMVNNRYAMDPSPIPKYDTPKLNNCKALQIFGAGREKKIYAIPPYTKVVPLKFEDREFKVESFDDKICSRCGSSHSFLDEVYDDNGDIHYYCNDTDFCDTNLESKENI